MNIFVIAGRRPAKRIDLPNGGADYLVWNWEKAEFDSDLRLGYDLVHQYEPGTDGLERATDTREVSEAEFNEYVESLRQEKQKERNRPK